MGEFKMGEALVEKSAEKSMEELQGLAKQFKSGEMSEEEKVKFIKLADAHIARHHTGDHGYHADCPSDVTSYCEYAFYDLPNGMCLEGRAGNHQNVFMFHDVLTAEEREKRIAYLESTAKDQE